jgi:hypothetical protein
VHDWSFLAPAHAGLRPVRVVWIALVLSPLFGLAPALAGIPATPVMTVYQFNGPLSLPFYDADRFLRNGPSSPAGTLAQGTSVIPCLVIRGGKPLADSQGTPYVGFEIVVDARDATPASTVRFTEIFKQRQAMQVANHHCPAGTEHVIEARKLYALGKPPRFDPPRPERSEPFARPARGGLDEIVRAFHASVHCEGANRRLVGRRDALRRAWDTFIAESRGRWPERNLTRAMHLDYVMRTALYEGHLDRGCNAYGACERNVIALSIRNRGLERCLSGQGCRYAGDFEGVASAVSQYNIWDEYLTQTSGLTSCFLRPDLAGHEHYARLQAMYEQSAGDIERILYGGEGDLKAVFPGHSPAQLARLRHYYHPPAMGKCFPNHPRLEYMSGAVAQRDQDFALIANTWIHAGERRGSGYLFRQAIIDNEPDRDVVSTVDRYPGFVVDGRKVRLERPSGCTPYGVPRACRFETIGRHRRTPSWLSAGESLRLTCRVRPRGEDCRGDATPETTSVGGVCDTWMQPVAGVP